jgi:cyclic lactone autoinducer peptide
MKIKLFIFSILSSIAFSAALQTVSTISMKTIYQPVFPKGLQKHLNEERF